MALNNRRLMLKAMASIYNRYERPALFRELRDMTGLSLCTLHRLMVRMVEEGLVYRIPGGPDTAQSYLAVGWP